MNPDWAAIASVAGTLSIFVGITFVLFVSRRDARRGEMLERELLWMQERLLKAVAEVAERRTLNGLDTVAMEYLADSIQRLPRDLSLQIENLTASLDREYATQHVTIINSSEPGAQSANSQNEIVREIAHSLNTPLLAIESTALTMRATLEESHSSEMLLEAVNVCKSFIAAYEGLTAVFGSDEAWSPDSLRASIDGAARLYSRRLDKDVVVESSLPDSIEGYSNSVLAAIILPLLENAVEASPPHGKVVIEWDDLRVVRIVVKNQLTGPLPELKIYSPGETTKDGHQGLGLATVSRLVSSYRDGQVGHDVDGDWIAFTVSLPKRQ
ncbi:sensor histidine kinase [Krasilnikovia sp. M28-CT-15]|uniref:sensor histidine kinase n=1 Tax=Krasilnikovia sp. M28-CT-15 TaxID=3373540 RepID=UPI0038778399